jgi:hypothetical protein
MTINPETQALAIGLIRTLREQAPGLDELAEGMPVPLRIEYRALIRRALDVTEETTWGEVNSLYLDYLEMAARHGMTPTAEMN